MFIADKVKTCSFDSCDRPARKKDLCDSHAKQARSGIELKPLRARGEARLCTFPDCGLPHEGKGYCRGHLEQNNQGKELAPLRLRSKWVDGMKVCPKCAEKKSASEYGKNSRSASGLMSYCKACARNLSRKKNLSQEN